MSDNKWRKYNDETVTASINLTEEFIRANNATPYILFYKSTTMPINFEVTTFSC